MKLTYKLFTAFLATSIMIVVLMIAVLQYYASRNFSAYVGRVEMEQLGDILPRLEQEYRNHRGWEHLRGDWEAWVRVLHLRSDNEGNAPRPKHPRREGPPEKDGDQILRPPPRDVRPRLTLFDRSKRLVMGQGTTAKDHVLKEIKVDGQVVGYLGLRMPERLSDPLQIDFLYQQTEALYLIGGAILLLTALLTFILARQFLLPVRQLARGAHALSSRRFRTRIQVRSSDELGQLSADFNRMADTLERHERLRRQWITDLSHELRTPLSVLLAEIDAVLDGVRDMHRETLESIQSEVLLITKLVDDLHALSLLESDALSMAREEVDVLKVASDILQGFVPRFSQAGIALESRLDEKREVIIAGDKARLSQVFTNLTENSLKYTDPPGRLLVGHHVEGGTLHLTFDDTLPGVSQADLPNIFERLYRADRSRSREKSGSGLGLAISKAIIEGTGGTIEACASPLGGLRVEIVLPIVSRFEKSEEKKT
jgi:two-component system, OmpR family, sensor histidine kinase BaeS